MLQQRGAHGNGCARAVPVIRGAPICEEKGGAQKECAQRARRGDRVSPPLRPPLRVPPLRAPPLRAPSALLPSAHPPSVCLLTPLLHAPPLRAPPPPWSGHTWPCGRGNGASHPTLFSPE